MTPPVLTRGLSDAHPLFNRANCKDFRRIARHVRRPMSSDSGPSSTEKATGIAWRSSGTVYRGLPGAAALAGFGRQSIAMTACGTEALRNALTSGAMVAVDS